MTSYDQYMELHGATWVIEVCGVRVGGCMCVYFEGGGRVKITQAIGGLCNFWWSE